jgi:signal transduction histidine kinase
LLTAAVLSGAVLTVLVVRISLTRALDSSAVKTGNDVAALVLSNKLPTPILTNNGGVVQVQVVDADNRVVDASSGGDFGVSILSVEQLRQVRDGSRIEVAGVASSVDDPLRVVGVVAGDQTVLVATDAGRVNESVRIIRDAAVIGCPLAILAMALLTYWVVGQTLRPVAALRHGAEEITAAGLAGNRLPVPDAQDEIHRLAVTLNAMLDRIVASTTRQRTFVGDAAHELRSPLASLRVQLEVAGRLGPATDWDELIDEVLIDVDRLEHLVSDLLILARSDEAGGVLRHREPVALGELAREVAGTYTAPRVPLTVETVEVEVDGDADSLRRVIVNLIDNALRYAATTVSVQVVQVVQPDGPAGQPTAQLRVADDGPGIDADERERVFDRFYRTAESRSRESGGTGLGLPIVRDLVRAHGGTVRLTDGVTEADDGHRGLIAIVTLPART